MNVPAQRKPNGQLLPGFTANPSGRPKVVGEIRELARQHAPAAFKRICDLVESDDERIALAASQEILNRAYGRPVQAVESKIEKVSMSQSFVRAARLANGYDEMGRKIIEPQAEENILPVIDVEAEPVTEGKVEW
jgi:hypothetical protein